MKHYFLTIDTETTQDQLVADFGAVISDRKGRIVKQCAVLLSGIYDNQESHPLFHQHGDAGDLWSAAGLPKRYARYNRMLDSGARIIASVGALQRWLDKANSEYSPILTAYNLAFDLDKCERTGIDLTQFGTRFCLWQAAYSEWAHTAKYLQFVLDTHAFNPPTHLGNMTFKTNAETMARFLLGAHLPDEPHTALEDVVDYELPILNALLSKRSVRHILTQSRPYNWKECQLRDWFGARASKARRDQLTSDMFNT